jgi:hypothetical protein
MQLANELQCPCDTGERHTRRSSSKTTPYSDEQETLPRLWHTHVRRVNDLWQNVVLTIEFQVSRNLLTESHLVDASHVFHQECGRQ